MYFELKDNDFTSAYILLNCQELLLTFSALQAKKEMDNIILVLLVKIIHCPMLIIYLALLLEHSTADIGKTGEAFSETFA
eukprot:snap_masked-scaffold_5-processed-gene-16.51-mRNA-1 protein AED:1.00 eAED:1.00 QI:0/0/0/0/1/1/2/0/79